MALAVRSSVWDPFNGLVRQMDRDFDSVIRRSFGARNASGAGFVPAADVVRDGSDVVIRLELPGIDSAADLDVEVSDRRLVVSGQRSSVQENTDDGRSTVLVREIRTGAFRREFALPEGVGAEQVEADYDRGVLQVRVRELVKPANGPAKIEVRGPAVASETGTDN